MENKDIVKVLNEISALLELKDETFRSRAYRRAARSIEDLQESLQEVAARNELEEIPGVGKAIAKKIEELLETGHLQYLMKLRNELSPELVELLEIPGIGPKTVKVLRDELGVQNVDQLRLALESHEIRDLPGFGPKSEENIQRSLEMYLEHSFQHKGRTFIGIAYPIAQHLIEELKQLEAVEEIEVAGSLRRWKETVGDIDILVTSTDPVPIMKHFVNLPSVVQVLAHGPTKSSIILEEGIQVDIRVIEPESFGAALQYFTGSKAHNISLRRLARQKGLKLSEYGLFDVKTDKRIAGSTEEGIYQKLGMPWIPPELREETGEIRAALENRLPALIRQKDIRGDLHVHTNWSDGKVPIDKMAKAAQHRGYEYVGICDHSKRVQRANGLDENRLREQIETIHRLDKQMKDIRILAGIEVDIHSDGSLDISDDVLAETDLVVVAIHFGRIAPEQEMTERITKALKNPYVDILAHPTGRIVGQRSPYEVNLEELIREAKKRKVVLEINSLFRLDLPDTAARLANEKGVKLAINTDAHEITQFDAIVYGVAMARRGWVEATDVINTLPFAQLKRTLKHVH
ncbi:MAG: DNA polymerase/3'-5' exonuclease PolX [Promethearchaeota archaeon]